MSHPFTPQGPVDASRSVICCPEATLDGDFILLGAGKTVEPAEDFFLWELFDLDLENETDVVAFVRAWGTAWDEEEPVPSVSLRSVITEIQLLRDVVWSLLLVLGRVTPERYLQSVSREPERGGKLRASIYAAPLPPQDIGRVATWAADVLEERLYGFSPQLIRSARPRSISEVVALDLFNAVVTGRLERARPCAWCGRFFINQRGRNRWRHRGDEQVRYCSAAHASSYSSKQDRLRRQRLKLLNDLRAHGASFESIAMEWNRLHPEDQMTGTAMNKWYRRQQEKSSQRSQAREGGS